MDKYIKQAEKFLKETETELKAEFLKNGLHFPEDKDIRDIYKITLKRGEREFIFNFGNSLKDSGKWICYTPKGKVLTNDRKEANKLRVKYANVSKNKDFKEPSSYDILACLTSYDPDTFEEFCKSYGYDEDSRKAERIYKAVVKEWENVKMLWNDEEIKKLRDIN